MHPEHDHATRTARQARDLRAEIAAVKRERDHYKERAEHWCNESLVDTGGRGRAMLDREELGRRVREIWCAWAREQPSPKPRWLIGWDDLDEASKEVDRRVGETIAADVLTARWDEEIGVPDDRWGLVPRLRREVAALVARLAEAERERATAIPRIARRGSDDPD